MPRPKTHTQQSIVAAALQLFWRQGFEATSMDDLVRETGVSRHALYGAFSGKQTLFMACLDAYSAQIVSEAFAPVERDGATLETVAAYFERQIAFAERLGLPGPGCLMANSMTERAPHDDAALAKVRAHNARLEAGFLNALQGEARRAAGAAAQRPAASTTVSACAALLVVFANGLWSISRQVDDAETLRRSVREILEMVQERILK